MTASMVHVNNLTPGSANPAAGGLLATGSIADLAAAAPELERAFAGNPAAAAAGLRRHAWPALPSVRTAGGGDAFASYFSLLKSCRVAMGTAGAGAEVGMAHYTTFIYLFAVKKRFN